MANTNGTATPTLAESKAIEDLIAEINGALCKVIGTASSISDIASSLPHTPLGHDDALCPELVFPALGQGVIHHANAAMSLLEELESALDSAAESPKKGGAK